jgi:hypothetical protein
MLEKAQGSIKEDMKSRRKCNIQENSRKEFYECSACRNWRRQVRKASRYEDIDPGI